MSWFLEAEKKFPTKHNGTVRLSRFFGAWTLIGHDGTGQSSPYMNALWRKLVRHAVWRGLNVRRCLILGVAMGGTFMIVRRSWPDAEIIGVDWEPDLYALGRRIGVCKPDAKMTFIEGDAMAVAPTLEERGVFDLVIIDMFNGHEVADAVTNPSLQQSVISMLAPGGMLMLNCYREHAAIENWTQKFGKPLIIRYSENEIGVFTKK